MKIQKLPPIKLFISGSDKEITIEEAKEHIKKLAKLRRNPKNEDIIMKG